jgi:hypothetical protein
MLVIAKVRDDRPTPETLHERLAERVLEGRRGVNWAMNKRKQVGTSIQQPINATAINV